MNSREYLGRLAHALRKLPAEERADVMAYYSELFDEAGEAGAAALMERLGSPKQLAQGIRADSALRDAEEGRPRVRKGVSAVWIAVLGVFAAPIGLPIAVALFCVLVAFFIVVVSVLVALLAAGVGIAVSGIVSFAVSFSLYFQSVPTGLFYMGAGLACIGLGLLFGIGVYLLARTMLRGMARLAARIRHGRASRRWKANARKAQQDAGQTVRPGAGLGQAMPQDAGWAMQDAGQAMPKDAGSVMPHDTGQTMPQDTGQAVPQIEKKEDGHA